MACSVPILLLLRTKRLDTLLCIALISNLSSAMPFLNTTYCPNLTLLTLSVPTRRKLLHGLVLPPQVKYVGLRRRTSPLAFPMDNYDLPLAIPRLITPTLRKIHFASPLDVHGLKLTELT